MSSAPLLSSALPPSSPPPPDEEAVFFTSPTSEADGETCAAFSLLFGKSFMIRSFYDVDVVAAAVLS